MAAQDNIYRQLLVGEQQFRWRQYKLNEQWRRLENRMAIMELRLGDAQQIRNQYVAALQEKYPYWTPEFAPRPNRIRAISAEPLSTKVRPLADTLRTSKYLNGRSIEEAKELLRAKIARSRLEREQLSSAARHGSNFQNSAHNRDLSVDIQSIKERLANIGGRRNSHRENATMGRPEIVTTRADPDIPPIMNNRSEEPEKEQNPKTEQPSTNIPVPTKPYHDDNHEKTTTRRADVDTNDKLNNVEITIEEHRNQPTIEKKPRFNFGSFASMLDEPPSDQNRSTNPVDNESETSTDDSVEQRRHTNAKPTAVVSKPVINNQIEGTNTTAQPANNTGGEKTPQAEGSAASLLQRLLPSSSSSAAASRESSAPAAKAARPKFDDSSDDEDEARFLSRPTSSTTRNNKKTATPVAADSDDDFFG